MIYHANPLAQAVLANVEFASTAAGFDNVGTKDVNSLRAGPAGCVTDRQWHGSTPGCGKADLHPDP